MMPQPPHPDPLMRIVPPLSFDKLRTGGKRRYSGPKPGEVGLPSSYFDSHSTTVGR